MYPSYLVLFVFGQIQLLQLLAASCPPNNNDVTEAIQFCSDSEVTSSNIYIDSSDVSTRVTNCTCKFNVTVKTNVVINNTLSSLYDCRTFIRYGDENSKPLDVCGYINVDVEMIQSQTYSLVLINGDINLKTYCLHLFTANESSEIQINCFQDFYSSTTKTKFKEQSSTIQTTSFYSVLENKDVSLGILASVISGAVVFIAMLIIAIVCYRRRSYKTSIPKINQHGNMNQAVIDNDDDDGDCKNVKMRENEICHNMENELQEEFAEGYAEINLPKVRLQKSPDFDVGSGYAVVQPSTHASSYKSSIALYKKDKTIFSLASNSDHVQDDGGGYEKVQSPECANSVRRKPCFIHRDEATFALASNSHLNHVYDSAVFPLSVKIPTNNHETNNKAPAYAMPEKEKKQQNVESLYATVNNKNKNDDISSYQMTASKTTTNKKPPVALPKSIVPESGNRRGTVTKNKETLYYSEVVLFDQVV